MGRRMTSFRIDYGIGFCPPPSVRRWLRESPRHALTSSWSSSLRYADFNLIQCLPNEFRLRRNRRSGAPFGCAQDKPHSRKAAATGVARAGQALPLRKAKTGPSHRPGFGMTARDTKRAADSSAPTHSRDYFARARCAQERPRKRKQSFCECGSAAALRKVTQDKKPCPDEGDRCIRALTECG